MSTKKRDYEIDKVTRTLANYMARHIVGENFSADDETCRLCIKATRRALYQAYVAGQTRQPLVRTPKARS